MKNYGEKEVFKQVARFGVALATASLVLLMAACSGDTDGGDANDDEVSESTFVSDSSTTGSISLNVGTTSLAVASTTGFLVNVTDSTGAPVPDIRVACDTESGLAIIEPTTGIEATSGTGVMSGVVGCEAPGSFQMGCRLPIGANKRVFETIICRGDIPEGFTGFEGAGGGSLFGGTAVPENGGAGGTSTDGVVIDSVYFDDGGESPTNSIDTIFNSDCDGDGTPDDPESFTDAYVEFKIRNDSNKAVRIANYRFSVPQATGSGTARYTSPRQALAGSSDGTVVVPANGGEITVRGLFAQFAGASDKRFAGSSSDIPSSLGFRNVSFTLFGSNDDGDNFTLQITAGASFSGFDRC